MGLGVLRSLGYCADMRPRSTARVLVLLLAVSLLPAMAISLLPAMTVRATHEPTTDDVVTVAQGMPWNMSCDPNATPNQWDCTGFFASDFASYAHINPAAGPLQKVVTEAYAYSSGTNIPSWTMSTNDRNFTIALHSVGCFNSKAVTTFVDDALAAMADPGLPAHPPRRSASAR